MIVQDPNRVALSPAQKARRINMDPDLYGTFAEIGGARRPFVISSVLVPLRRPLQRR
jgi:hypothetical protein